jgi:chromosomal replication initiator protein
VAIEPLSAAGRLAFLCDQAQRRQLAVAHEVLAWLARHLVGGRQLQGALTRLEALVKAASRPLDVATVAKHFEQDADATRPTLERIARQVSSHFRVDARQLKSQRRAHHVLLPRQVSMYLARKLTDLSLDEIGTYFGGRDHSTVLHACRKVEQAVNRDIVLHGTVRQLRADLT